MAKRNIEVKEKALIDKLNNAVNNKKAYETPTTYVWDNNGPVQFDVNVDTANDSDHTDYTVYKDGTPVKHYDGNDGWKNNYFSGKTVVENQIDLDPVTHMTEDEKKIFEALGPCSLEDIHRDSTKDADESRKSNKNVDVTDAVKKIFPRVMSEKEKRLIEVLNGVAANAESKDTQLRTHNDEDKPKSEHYEEVNHPDHYNQYDVEVIDMMERVFGLYDTYAFCKLNAFKYRQRMGNKPGQDILKDLAKEKWYLTRAENIKSRMTDTDRERATEFSEKIEKL